jgi:hypothetical protein
MTLQDLLDQRIEVAAAERLKNSSLLTNVTPFVHLYLALDHPDHAVVSQTTV